MEVPSRPSLLPLAALLAAAVALIPLDRWLFGLTLPARLLLGGGLSATFLLLLRAEDPDRRSRYLLLSTLLGILALAPIDTGLDWGHVVALTIPFAAVLLLPLWWLRGEQVFTFRFWPRRIDRLDVIYTLAAVPLAWLAFRLYFGVLSPEVPFNWPLPEEPDQGTLLRLFLGINAVGVWDELFFVNTCYALLRTLFPARIANPAQAVVYTVVLWDMAFSGWGPLFVAVLALTQGAMYERSKLLLWVLLVHLIVDYFLFQAIVEAYYPQLEVWWHP